ncbi:tetratricopeptide repeat protein [Phaeocystidibacter luteus]|uniref:Tetratricopeptide repeat protein n=1 Tax=Phaeocystidibacter luteus TaxID=911197 RepID=A0A6N6RGN6_9FLAO|nr:tetratricopeptide repeat protein [Phaeocystidibacter luteus]KAB2810315.1 tetratricopeptide repeat protein [Phaeocystidibacter luteus]
MRYTLLLALFAFTLASCDDKPKSDTNDSSQVVSPMDSLAPADAGFLDDSLNAYLHDNPFSVDGLLARAERYISRKNYRYAEADIRAAKELDSLNPKVLLLWGDIHFFNNKTRVSRDAWKKCIEVDPQSVDCRLKLAELYRAIGDLETSTKLVREVIDIDSEEPVSYFILASNYRDMTGDTATAIRYVQEAIERDPDFFAALDYAAVMAGDLKMPIAESYYQRLIELDPNNPNVYFNQGWYYQSIDNYNEAIKAYTKVMDLQPKNFMAPYHLGYIHLELDLRREAIGYFNKSIEAQQVNHRAYFARGWTYEQMGDIIRAEQDYRQALAYNPTHQDSKVAIQRVQQQIREMQAEMNAQQQ